jgi:hypothetical protein
MEAGIDLGFTALMAAAVSEGQRRDRASRPQKELYYDIVGLLLKNSTCQRVDRNLALYRARGGTQEAISSWSSLPK